MTARPNKGTFQKGPDPRRGRGAPKGTQCRPTLAFAQECARLQREVILVKCRAELTKPRAGPGDPAWEWAAAYVSKYGEREAVKEIDVTSGGEALALPLRERVAQIKALIEGAPCS